MKVIVTENHLESCEKVAKIMMDIINQNDKPVLGLATGGTAEQVYEELVKLHKNSNLSFKNVSTVNLDEYIGLDPTHNQSYRYFMNHHLFNKVDINIENTYVPLGNAEANTELKKFQDKLNNTKRHFQILGVGPNGHVAFNEPNANLHANAHIVDIAESTIEANSRYFNTKDDVPKRAFTQGMGDILKAEKIVLLATGENKSYAMKRLLLGDEVSTECPCTLLKTHSNTTIFIDKDLATLIGFKC